jgi:hypothetical protein
VPPTISQCNDTVVATWDDVLPADMPLAAGPILRLERVTAAGVASSTWDDDPFLEVRVLERTRTRGARWEMRWERRGRGGEVRLVVLARPGVPERRSETCPPVLDLAPEKKR